MKKQSYTIKWTINPYRKNKRVGPLSPIQRSNYLKMLFKEEENRLSK